MSDALNGRTAALDSAGKAVLDRRPRNLLAKKKLDSRVNLYHPELAGRFSKNLDDCIRDRTEAASAGISYCTPSWRPRRLPLAGSKVAELIS